MANLLAARDQENLINAHQSTAVGKPLNQTIRALHPKTLGNPKTPFRLAKNDENVPINFKGQKTTGQNAPGKLDKNAFVTPLAPRNRAPLGIKTTNAKAHTFQTPAPAPMTAKPGRTAQKQSTARRSGRSKVTIAPSEPVDTDLLAKKLEEEEEPDFGYAPPPPVELPDPPIEFEEDPELTEELRAGHGVPYPYDSPKDKDGVSLRRKMEEQGWKKFDEERVQRSLEGIGKPVFPTLSELDKQVDEMIAAGPKKRPPLSRVDSMQSRSAAAALSEPQPRLPSVAMRPTQASEQKKRGVLPAMKSKSSTTPIPPASKRSNHAALVAAVSKNTIGFPKAKKAPSIIPRGAGADRSSGNPTPKPAKVDQASIHPRDFRDMYGSPPEESDMWFRLKHYELLEADLASDNGGDDESNLFDTDFFPFENAKLDDEDFQLPMPE